MKGAEEEDEGVGLGVEDDGYGVEDDGCGARPEGMEVKQPGGGGSGGSCGMIC